jgi:hypothetical protein
MEHVNGVVDDALHKVPVHDVGVVDDHWMGGGLERPRLARLAGAHVGCPAKKLRDIRLNVVERAIFNALAGKARFLRIVSLKHI